jgi:hypothetical protein
VPAFELEAFIVKCPAALVDDVRRLHDLITRAAPSLAPVIQGPMLAYGPFRYRYETGREGDSARVALACRKSGLSLYVNCVSPDGYLSEQHAAQFPKAKVGKSCIAFKRLADLDSAALTKLMKLAAKTKGAGEITAFGR